MNHRKYFIQFIIITIKGYFKKIEEYTFQLNFVQNTLSYTYYFI